jgi:hypothetical protein
MNSVYAFFDTVVSNPVTTFTLDCRKGLMNLMILTMNY